MRAPRKCLIVSALAMAVLPTIASAAVVYSDGFESPTDTAGSAPVGGCTKGGGTSSFTMTVVSDATAGNGSQQALDLTSTTSSTRYGTTPFTATTLSPGDSIQLGFDLWFVGTLPTADRLFRFGLYNTALTNSPGTLDASAPARTPAPLTWMFTTAQRSSTSPAPTAPFRSATTKRTLGP